MKRPRRLSAKIKRAIYFSHPFTYMGPWFIVIGGAVCIPFVGNADLSGPFVFSKHDPRVEGRLVAKVGTGDAINEERIYDYMYAYEVGTARLEGHSFAPDNGALAASPVTVQYVASHPATSRLEGMRRAPFGWIAALVAAAFPAAGLWMQFSGFQAYRKRRYLAEHGTVCTGTVVRTESTGNTINDLPVTALTFQFQDSNGRTQEACNQTEHYPTAQVGTQLPLVYDADHPADALLLAMLPAALSRFLLPR